VPEMSQFRDYVLDQLSGLGEYKTKNMFGGTALLIDNTAFAKIKHGTLWLKVDAENQKDFLEKGMRQYRYGKDNSRKLNFYETPGEVLEDKVILKRWANSSIQAAQRTRK